MIYAIVEKPNGRLLITTPAHAISNREHIVKSVTDFDSAVRWARDEQRIRDALATVNGRRRYWLELIAGGLAVASLLACCIVGGIVLSWPAP